MRITLDLPSSGLSPDQEAQVEAWINGLLAEFGRRPERIADSWWTTTRVAELDGRTVAQALLEGDGERVREYLRKLEDEAHEGARRLVANPDRMAILRERIKKLS